MSSHSVAATETVVTGYPGTVTLVTQVTDMIMTTNLVVEGSVATGGSGSREGEGREVEKYRGRVGEKEKERRREGDKERGIEGRKERRREGLYFDRLH